MPIISKLANTGNKFKITPKSSTTLNYKFVL